MFSIEVFTVSEQKKKKNIISKIGLSRFGVKSRIEELLNNSEKSVKMKAANSRWFSTAMDKNTDVSDTA